MATSLYSPSSTDAQFVTEPIDRGDDGEQLNSLTKKVRSLTNVEGQQGQQAYGTGQKTFSGGIEHLAPVFDYLHKLVSGNATDAAAAVSPQTDAISQQFSQIRNMIGKTGPRTGGTAGVMAELPFEEARYKADAVGNARTAAVPMLGNLGTSLAGLGLGESQIGGGLEGNALSGSLAMRGQDSNENAQSTEMIAGLGKAVGSILGGPIGAKLFGRASKAGGPT